MKTPPKSKKPIKPVRIRDQVLAAVLSEAGRQAVKLIGYVAIAMISQHIGVPEIPPQVLLV